MQRRPSQTFQRIRKLSDSIIQAVVPSAAVKAGPEDSFFDYSKKGWHAPHSPAEPAIRRRPSYRKVSKEEIRYPLIHPNDTDTVDLWVESATMSAERKRPPRPSLDERPLVVSDSLLRNEEERMLKRANTAKRPERPKEQDLPYGARGSLPKPLMNDERPPPPAVGRRPSLLNGKASAKLLPFPSHGAGAKDASPGGRGDSPEEKPPELPPKIFTPFSPLTQREIERRRLLQASSTNRSTGQVGATSMKPPPSTAQDGVSVRGRQDTVVVEERRRRGREHTEFVPEAQHLKAPLTGSTYTEVRRTSSGGVNLPPQHAHYRALPGGDKNDPRTVLTHPAPELRTVQPTPLNVRQPPSVLVPLPAHPAVYLQKGAGTRPWARHPDVPRDVSPDNPHCLPTLRRSAEEKHPAFRAAAQREIVKNSPVSMPPQPAPPTPASVAAKAQASLRLKDSCTPQTFRAVSYTAEVQIIRPEQERVVVSPEKGRGRERERDWRRERERKENPREVQYYGMADVFARQIALALAEPERTEPLSIDWDQFVKGGKDYGTKPLVTRKAKQRA